jgi:hypothetical protein
LSKLKRAGRLEPATHRVNAQAVAVPAGKDDPRDSHQSDASQTTDDLQLAQHTAQQ